MLCNVDTPADASRGRYVPLSHVGLPKPWYKYAMDNEVGDMTVFVLELIRCGGAVPDGLPLATSRIIAFIALANCNMLYNNAGPITPQSWSYVELEVLSSEKYGRSGCRKKVAQPQTVCFMCQKVPLCHNHATGICLAWDHSLAAPTPKLFQAPRPDSGLQGCVILCAPLPPHASCRPETPPLLHSTRHSPPKSITGHCGR